MEEAIEELKLSIKKVETVGDALQPWLEREKYKQNNERLTCPICGKYVYRIFYNLAGMPQREYNECKK